MAAVVTSALLMFWVTDAIAQSLPTPRFASMRNDEANVRTGPGVQYPIEWVFIHQGLPVEIISEFDNWRQIRDWQGEGGWVHRSQLSGRRTAILIAEEPQELLRDPRPNAGLIARIEPQVMGDLVECPEPATPGGAYCLFDTEGYRGWVPRTLLWGVYADEVVE
jgi:SH3-like domain-containing protein